MGCKLTQNIKHNCEYNPGGIVDVFLLDIRDFEHYKFEGDGLYDSCYVEDIIKKSSDFIKLDVVNESAFTESKEGGIYKQELQTFVRSLSGAKTSQLLLARANKYIVAYRTHDGKAFSFGLDGGASVAFTQQTGQLGDASGYQITITKSSIYPQFEIDEEILKLHLLSSEDSILMVTEDDQFCIELERSKPSDESQWIEVTKAWDESLLPDVVNWNSENTPYFKMWHQENNVPEMQEPFILRRIVYHSAVDSGKVRIGLINDALGLNVLDNQSIEKKGLNILDLNIRVDKPVKTFSFSVYRGGALKMAGGVIQPEYGRIFHQWDRYREGEFKDWSLGIGVYIERIQK